MNDSTSATHEYLIGTSKDTFDDQLPREIDVLRLVWYNEALPEAKRITKALHEIKKCYHKAGILIRKKETIRIKVKRLVSSMKRLLSKRKIKSRREKDRQEDFARNILKLFEVCDGNEDLSTAQREFLNDQRTDRLHQIGTNFQSNCDVLTLAENQDGNYSSDYHSTDTDNSSDRETDPDSDPDFDSNGDPDSDPDYSPSEDESNDDSHRKMPISENLLEETSSSKASYRTCEKLLKIGIKIPGANPNNFAVSKSALWKRMTKIRANKRNQLFEELASTNGKVVIQFDGKSCAKLNERHIGKDERLIIVCHTEQKDYALGLFPIPSKRGAAISGKVTDAIHEHDLEDRVVAMVADTEAPNTGPNIGACVLIEEDLDRELIHLMCRHHSFERILEAAFVQCFGPSSAPRIDIFDILNQNWAEIKNGGYIYNPIEREKLNSSPLKKQLAENAKSILLIHANHNHFRKDYAELIDLALKFLGVNTGKTFKVPGATSNARWMARAIYALKTYLFRVTLELSQDSIIALERFCLFVASVYVKFWDQCPNVSDAPINDLKLLKEIDSYKQIDEQISEAALRTMSRHLWYLGDELAPLSFFSDAVSDNDKRTMALAFSPVVGPRTNNSIRYTGELHDIQSLELVDFFSTRSSFIFQLLEIDTEFLQTDPSDWNDNNNYLRAKKMIHDLLTVVNDAAERGLQIGANLIDGQRAKSEKRLQEFFVSAYSS